MAHDIAWFKAQEERLRKQREAKEGKKPEPQKVEEVKPVEEQKQEIFVKNSSEDRQLF